MNKSRLASFWRILKWTMVISLPAFILLGVLALGGHLPMIDALIGAAVVFGLIVVLGFTVLQDFNKLIRYAEDLAEDPGTPAPKVKRSETARRLVGALTALQKSWAEGRTEATSLARSRAAILDTLPDPFLTIGKDRSVVSVNQAAKDVFGEQQTGRDLAAVIRDPHILDATDEALKTGRGGFAQFSTNRPVERSFGCMIGYLQGDHENDPVVLLQLHDMTEQVKMSRMRADFVANASHELRTPLSSLLGFIETLSGSAKDDEQARDAFLDIMHKQAAMMTRLIDDLLSLSRIELKEHARPTDAVDVGLIMQSTCELLGLKAKEQNTTLNIELDDDVPLAIGDTDEIGQVFQNLITNAIKYGGHNKPVDITIKKIDSGPPGVDAGPWVRISVCDHGEGIAREHLPRLTERFYRVDAARSRELGGTGLGLAIVKHITKRHRGHLIIDSTEGEGSVFTVYLPIADESQRQAQEQITETKQKATAA